MSGPLAPEYALTLHVALHNIEAFIRNLQFLCACRCQKSEGLTVCLDQ